MMNQVSLICKIMSYTSFVAGQWMPWINSLSSIDRYLAVRFPCKLKWRTLAKYQAIAVVAIFVSLLLLDLPFYFYVDIPLNQTGCTTIDYEIGKLLSIWFTVITIVIPVTIMIIFTALTTRRLIKRKMYFNKKDFTKEKRYFKILLWLNIYLIICYFPYPIIAAITMILKIQFFGTLAYSILKILVNAYASFDFFVYFSSNKLFREHVFKSIGCKAQANKNLRTLTIK